MRKIFFLLVFISANQAFAQVQLDSVTIRGNCIQMPFSEQNRAIQVIDRKQIESLPVHSASDLLAYAAGVDLRRRGPNGTQADISIDGSSFDQVLVLLNGVKMSDPQTGHHMMNLPIPLSAIDRIEILRGPAAAIYGVNALAGAINIVTQSPTKNAISVDAYGGSNLQKDTASGDTYYNWGTQASIALAGKKQAQLLSLSNDQGNGYRYNTNFKASKVYYQNHVRLNDKNQLDAEGAYLNNDFGGNGFYAAPYDANSTEKVQTAFGSIRHTFSPNERLTLKPGVGFRYNADDYIFKKQNPSYYQNHHETSVFNAELHGTLRTGGGVLGAGFEYRKEYINSNNLGERTRENTGLYAEYRRAIWQRLNTTAGVYGNYNSVFGWNIYPALNASLSLGPNWKLNGNIGTGQRLPTFTDLYYKDPSNIGNPDLKPETARFGEAGITYQHRMLRTHAAAFYRTVDNMIDWVRESTTTPWQPTNYQTVNTKGLTGDVLLNIASMLHWDQEHPFNIHASYTYLDMSIELPNNALSKYAINSLRHQFVAGASVPVVKNVYLHANARYQYRINGYDYTLLDARLDYKIKSMKLYADVNNILNTQYKEIGAIPMPGRWYVIGAHFEMP